MTLRQAALVVGFAYLFNPVPVAEFAIYPKLVIPGEVAQTVANLSAHPSQFLLAILFYSINFTEDILISWGLYVLLAPVNRALSLLAALFRLMYTAIAFGSMFNLVTVYHMVTNPEFAKVFGSAQLGAQIDLLLHTFRYDYATSICLIFSLHLILVGYLIMRSRYIPLWLGVVLILNGLGWLVSNLQPYLYPSAHLDFVMITYFGELVLMLWLLIFGWRLRDDMTPNEAASTT